MTASAQVAVDVDRVRGRIDPRVYGQFLEHVGRAVYGGVYEPGSRLADEAGYRLDVLAACRDLAPTVLRWPGGNFASGYHWADGVGPVDQRPTRRDLAWGAVETNRFGTEEFLELSRRLGAAPYLNLNMSTGTIDEALGWLEYCNGSDPLPEVARRRAGPHPQPHDVRIWGLGNENYGWWQHGHTAAAAYAAAAREWGKLLHWTDPNLELIAVGAPDPDWNWTVLSKAGRVIDHLSLHCYWHGAAADMYHGTLAGPAASEQEIVATYGMCLAAQRAAGLPRPVRLAVDEWGVWSHTVDFGGTDGPDLNTLMRHGLTARAGIDTSFEEPYDLKDALAVATWLNVLWRHPEKVSVATQAQMVNVIAPVHTHPGGVVRHTVFHPLATARALAGPLALDVLVRTAARVPAAGVGQFPDDALPALDAAGTWDPDTGAVHLSLVNRLRDEALTVDVRGLSGPCRRVVLTSDDPGDGNTVDAPDRVVPVEDRLDLAGHLVLPPHSHVTIRGYQP